jgi:hypothetical protein
MRSFLVPDGAGSSSQQAYAEVIAIHAALLPTSKILYFGGDEHDPGRHHLAMVDAKARVVCLRVVEPCRKADETVRRRGPAHHHTL